MKAISDKDFKPNELNCKILQLMAFGHTYGEISKILTKQGYVNIGSNRVSERIRYMVDNYECRGRIHLAIVAFKKGWIE